MLFNSFEFAMFFVAVFVVYWFVLHKSYKSQNVLILVSSYFFYGWWDWRYLILIFVSSLVDYLVGAALGKTELPRYRKILLCISIATNLGILGFFKYFDFFVESFIESFAFLGLQANSASLNLIIPVGISFYTLQTLSYTIDVYRRKISPTHEFVTFFSFVSFFPQLVAGPIERAGDLIPQLSRSRYFSYEMAQDGLRLILWGLFMKIVIADSLAPAVDTIFADYQTKTGSTLLLGCAYFAVQVYCDFAGYSYMAIGLAKLLGINLTINFRYPLLQSSVRDLWRSWHISLMKWLLEYIYFPLQGLINNRWKKLIAINIVFLVCGLWHGPSWSFVGWGLINGIYLSVLMLMMSKTEADTEKTTLPLLRQLIGIGTTFMLFIVTAPFFRGQDLSVTFDYYAMMLSPSLFSIPTHLSLAGWVALLLVWEWSKRDKDHPLVFVKASTAVRWSTYCLLGILIIRGFDTPKPFVYFQF